MHMYTQICPLPVLMLVVAAVKLQQGAVFYSEVRRQGSVLVSFLVVRSCHQQK